MCVYQPVAVMFVSNALSWFFLHEIVGKNAHFPFSVRLIVDCIITNADTVKI